MSEAKDVGDQKPEETSDDKELLDELLFKQDLNEVHLLIDFVSGRADRSLSMLSMPDPEDPTKTMASGEVMKAIAEMRFPPEGTKAVNARNAAILLIAKDRLSALATPANGLTIAYTRLFIDAEGEGSFWFACRRWLERWTQHPTRHHDIRIDLAQRSFPGLQAHARKFCVWRDRLALFSLIWLFLTALAYWDAGLGRAALERLDQDWKTIVGELKDNPALIHCDDASAEPARTGADVKPSDDTTQKQFACRRYNYLKVVGQTAGEQVHDVFRCEGMGRSRLVHIWCWHWFLSGSAVAPDAHKNRQTASGPPGSQKPSPTTAGEPGDRKAAATPAEAAEQVSRYAERNVAYWQTATSILSVFTAYVLPMMFALLGTLIGAFRAILNRIGSNELAPRDLVRMKVGIPSGLIAGFAVGLFLSPSSVPVQGAGGVAGQLTLTASGLGFLAGYASYSFFGFLDNMIRTVFPYGSTANAVVTRTASSPTTETRT
jgi:hypothetical protein